MEVPTHFPQHTHAQKIGRANFSGFVDLRLKTTAHRKGQQVDLSHRSSFINGLNLHREWTHNSDLQDRLETSTTFKKRSHNISRVKNGVLKCSTY